MPTISTIKLQDHLRVISSDRPQAFRYSFAISATLADNTDDISLFDIPAGFALFALTMDVSATLGNATVQLRAGTLALTPASTAGNADVDVQNNEDIPTTATRTVNLLVGADDISAAATVVVAGIIAPVKTIVAPVATVE